MRNYYLNIKIPIFIVILAVLMVSVAFAEQLTLTTYYPAPFGAYDRLQLVPRVALPVADCDESGEVGTMFVDNSDYTILYCKDNGGSYAWGPLPGLWTQNATDIYLSDKDAYVGIGIDPAVDLPLGTNKLTILGSGNDDTTSSLRIKDSGGTDLFTVRDDGTILINVTSLNSDVFKIIGDDPDVEFEGYSDDKNPGIDFERSRGTPSTATEIRAA